MIKKKWIDSCSSTSRPQNTKMTLLFFYLIFKNRVNELRFFFCISIRIRRFSYYVIDSLKYIYIISNPAWYSLTCISIVMYKEHWIVKYTMKIFIIQSRDKRMQNFWKSFSFLDNSIEKNSTFWIVNNSWSFKRKELLTVFNFWYRYSRF